MKQRVCAILRLPGVKGDGACRRRRPGTERSRESAEYLRHVPGTDNRACGAREVGWARSSEGKAKPSREAGQRPPSQGALTVSSGCKRKRGPLVPNREQHGRTDGPSRTPEGERQGSAGESLSSETEAIPQ